MPPVLTKLFELDGDPVICPPMVMPSMSPGDTVRNIEFRNKKWLAKPRSIRGVTFTNVGMSKTLFERLTFSNCHFEDCLFIAAHFREVEFHNCTFVNCNFWKARFEQTYLDPETISFAKRFEIDAANVGVTLYHSLLSNYADERQDEFFAKADMNFRRWKRHQLNRDLREEHIGWWKGRWDWARSHIYEKSCGFGYKPFRFFILTIAIFLAFSLLNYLVIGDQFSINGAPASRTSFVDTVFYSFSILTILGFSSIVPHSDFAKLLTVFEALASIGWISIFTSILVKRFLR